MAGIQAGPSARLSIELYAEIAKLQDGLDKAKRAVKGASGDIARNTKHANDNFKGWSKSAGDASRSTQTLTTASKGLAGAMRLIGAVSIGAMFVKAASSALKFSDVMTEVSTLVDTSVVSMEQLNKAALEQAKTFGTGATEQASALYQIISAGASTAAEATETLTAANKLAVGGVTDIKTAADGLTSVMNAYGAAAGSATNVSDAMFVAMKAGKTTIGELSASIGLVAPIASQLGASIDEVLAATAALTKGGQSTSVAMNGLRAILATIAKPSSEAATMAAKLGIEFNAAGLKSKGLAGFLQDLTERTGGSQEAMAQLFGGVEALVPVLALTGNAANDFAQTLDAMGVKAGETEGAFAKIMAGPGKQLDLLFSNIAVTAIELANKLLTMAVPALTAINQNFKAIISTIGLVIDISIPLLAAFASYKAATLVAAAATATMSGALGINLALLATSTRAIGILATAKIALSVAAGTAAAATRALTVALLSNPFVIVAAVVGGLVAAFWRLRDSQKEARAGTDNLINSLKSLASARSMDFGMKLNEAMMARNKLVERQLKLQNDLDTQGWFSPSKERELAKVTQRIGFMNLEIKASEKAFKDAGKAAASIAPPVAGLNLNLEDTEKAAKGVAKAAKEAAKAMAELQSTFDGMQSKLDPAGAARADYAKTLADLNRLFAAKMLDQATLDQWAAEALRRMRDALGSVPEFAKLSPFNIDMDKLKRDIAEATGFKTDVERRAEEDSRNRLLDTAYDFADVIGGAFGNAIGQMVSLIDRAMELFKSGSALEKALAGAGIGGAAAKATGGSGIGGAAGGAAGQALGTALAPMLGKLGAFAGPLGAIAGGILGGVVGGLFKKVKKASATIEIMAGEAVQTSLTGNSSKLKAVAGAMADSLIGGLMGIADELGGMLGDGLRVSIGQRKKTFRVDLSGQGRTKYMPSFDTEEEAVAFAIQSVIRQGAITGLRAGTEALLKGEGDLQAQLQKALSFENVFRELENRASPAKAAMAAITKEMNALIDIFEEAKATTEDYAKLFELVAIKQKEAIETAFEPIRTMLDDLKGKADQAGEAVRSAFDAVLGREGAAIQAYQDAVAAQAQAQAEAVREAFNSGQQRWLDAVTTGFTEEIGRIKDALGPLKDQARDFAAIAERLRDFTSDLSDAINPVKFSAAAAKAAAQAGDIGALQSLRDAAGSSATSRVEMVRNLAILRNAANGAAGGFEGKASAAEAQIAAAEAQIEAIGTQIELAKSQVTVLERIENATTSGADDLAQLLGEMQMAVAAADEARAMMDQLGILTSTEQSFAEAVTAYQEAAAARDTLLAQINEQGFADLIEVQQKTAGELVAALGAVVTRAEADRLAATSAAQAAIDAAAAVRVANDNNPWAQYLQYGIPGFASGGIHAGGLRVVGEYGPELEMTGPSRIMNADQVAGALMGGGYADEIGAAVASHLRPSLLSIATHTAKTAKTVDRWEGEGLPVERSVA